MESQMHDMHNQMPEDDHEAAMARSDLYKLAQYSAKLFKMIDEGQQLEGWVQAKITKAADYIASVYHFMAYEMKVSEYGQQLENADVYESELRERLAQRLMEAKDKVKDLKKQDALKHKKHKSDAELKEEEESSWDKMQKYVADKAKEKGTGKFDRKEVSPGVTRYTRKSSTFDDGGEDKEVKKAKKSGKVKEGLGNSEEELAKRSKQLQDLIALRKDPKYQSPEAKKALEARIKKQMDRVSLDKGEVMGPDGKPIQVKEASKGDGNLANNAKPYDKVTRGDVIAGRLGKDEMGGKKKTEALKGGQVKLDKNKNGKLDSDDFKKLRSGVKEGSKTCNETPAGKMCPVHGMKECGMYETSHQEKTTMKHVKNPTPGEKKAAKDIKPGVAGYKDRIDMLKSAEADGRLKKESTGDYSAKKAAAGKDIGKPGKQFAQIAKSAGEKYGSAVKGKAVAGKVLANLRKG